MSRLDLLDSTWHKLKLARYHADALLAILDQHPHEGPDEPLRVPLEAHLEGLAYTGTAAVEKTIRSFDPDTMGEGMSIPRMIRAAMERDSVEEQTFARDFEKWWMGRNRGTRYAQVARDLRNDAAHRVYEKAPEGPRWRMKVGNANPVPLDEFARGYLRELTELEELVWRATRLAAQQTGTGQRVR